MCFDNSDINEETLSGSGTTHCSNDIMISSGTVATETVTDHLLNAYTVGDERFKTSIPERIVQPKTGLFEPIKKLNLGNFSSLASKSVVSTKTGKQVTLKADRNLLARMLVIAQAHTIT